MMDSLEITASCDLEFGLLCKLNLPSYFNQVLYDLCLNQAQISGECLQDHLSSGFSNDTTL